MGFLDIGKQLGQLLDLSNFLIDLIMHITVTARPRGEPRRTMPGSRILGTPISHDQEDQGLVRETVDIRWLTLAVEWLQ